MIAKTAILLLFGVIVAKSSPITSKGSIQGCSKWNWAKCAGVVAKCALKCADGITSQSCISCVGHSYNTCKDCFLLAQVIKEQDAILKEIQVTKDSSSQSCSAWDWVKCAGVVAECAAECADGITSQSCISCVGDSYDTCKDCFLLAQVIKQQDAIFEKIKATKELKFNATKSANKTPTAHIEGCDWIECGFIVAGCTAVCAAAEVDLPACIACMGGSYSTCKDCFSEMNSQHTLDM